MARQIATGIDIGTSQTKVVIAEEVIENGRRTSRIMGTGLAESRGLTRGYITDPTEAAKSVRMALNQAEKTSGTSIRGGLFSVGGVGLSSVTSVATIVISRADLEITDKDLEAVLDAAEEALPRVALVNRKIINSVPVEYKVDGQPVLGRVEGLKGHKLEVKALFITAMVHHLEDIVRTAEEARVEAIDIFAAPVAASFVSLNKRQKRAGCMLVDIGAETSSMIVFENDNLLSLKVFPFGSSDITNEIALGLKVPLLEAENIKRGGFTHTSFSKKKFDDVVRGGAKHLFSEMQTHLKEIGRDGLLPAGVILTGGGADMAGAKDFAEEFLGLPTQVAEIHADDTNKNRIRDNVWATACGLSVVGFVTANEPSIMGTHRSITTSAGLKNISRKISSFISQFLP